MIKHKVFPNQKRPSRKHNNNQYKMACGKGNLSNNRLSKIWELGLFAEMIKQLESEQSEKNNTINED